MDEFNLFLLRTFGETKYRKIVDMLSDKDLAGNLEQLYEEYIQIYKILNEKGDEEMKSANERLKAISMNNPNIKITAADIDIIANNEVFERPNNIKITSLKKRLRKSASLGETLKASLQKSTQNNYEVVRILTKGK